MTTNTPPPVDESHLFGAESYDVVQRWAFQALGGDAFKPSVSPFITVSFTRGESGLWDGHIYGWPAEGPAPADPPWRKVADGMYTSPVGAPEAPAASGGADTELWLRPARGPLLDLGDVARGLLSPPPGLTSDRPLSDAPPRPVPVVPGPYDDVVVGEVVPARRWPDEESFNRAFGLAAYASTVRGAVQHEQQTARAAALDRGNVYEDRRPLELDLHTEAPKPKRETRRAKRERLQRERAEEAFTEVDTERAARDQAPLVDRAPGGVDVPGDVIAVPPSGHRPDRNGVAPVEYPLCESKIRTADKGVVRCARRHRPGLRNLTHTAHGYLWKDGDIRSPIND